MTYTTDPGRVLEGDEIDLAALIQGLWAQKWLIMAATFVITLGAALYTFSSKPVYEARIAVLPPTLSDIAGFNLARGGKSGFTPFTVDDIYAVFTRNLQSEESRRQFFRDVYLPSLDSERRSGSQDQLYTGFGTVLKIKAPTKSQPAYFIVVERHDPAQAAKWAKDYLDQVTRQSITDVLSNTQREVEIRSQQIQKELKILREFAKTHKNDRIVKLREALTVAEAVGLERPPLISGQVAQQLAAFMDGELMYMRGTKALRAEIEALEGRASDDPFIPLLRNLEKQYSSLNGGFQVSPGNMAVSRPDGAVETPDKPIKPKKALSLVLGVLLGGMLGTFIALVRLMFSKQQLAVAQNSSYSTGQSTLTT
ncbi:LPS O-antigen chain length determinant protein WzzB [Microbulbifer sp. 2304DJ12-6]|uniref:LPS O-antigen chain length determinant protein WzzB n=1 Tax=Microbulbifer sp. 2304DJ12-6 TaxID=3233340 RepID=UPI0039AFA5D3